MNTIREIQNLNKRELENCVAPEASWHTDYRNTAYVHISGLAFTLTEGDILTIFSQFGEPTYLHLAREKDSGKSRGYAWLKYEDQRSTDLAVDNLGGANVLGRVLKVDHAWYKRREDEDEEEARQRNLKEERAKSVSDDDEEADDKATRRPLLKEEVELAKLIREHDEDDPMKAYLIKEKKEEVEEALARISKEDGKERKHKHHHRHHRSHRRPHKDDIDRSDKDDLGGRRRDRERRHGRRSTSR